jgi:DnaJ-domain-containing protein 1
MATTADPLAQAEEGTHGQPTAPDQSNPADEAEKTNHDTEDYYVTLGVARDATQDDIKRAYRKLALKYVFQMA